MRSAQSLLLSAGLATLVAAQGLDFGQIGAAPTLASGPAFLDYDGDGVQTASMVTSISITGVATASVTKAPSRKLHRRDVAADPNYTPYYAALATGYTTFPGPTTSTDASHPCPTQPEAGTYCGFLNPLDPCAPQPDGYGPVPTPDTAEAFLAYEPLHSMAQAAPTNIPSTNGSSYNQVFKDLNASVSAQSYIALYTFQTYDVNKCALYCDNTTMCTAFNIFAERDPSLNPAKNDTDAPTVWGYYCPNPPSMTSFKCTLWGSSIDASLATNYGQKHEDFQIVITASDGYDKTNNTTPPDCTAPVQSSSTVSSTTLQTSTLLTSTLSTSSLSSSTVQTSSSSSSSVVVSSSTSSSVASAVPATTSKAVSSPSASPSVPATTSSKSSSSSSSSTPVKPTTISSSSTPVKPTSTSTSTTSPVKATTTRSSTSAAPTCTQSAWSWNPAKSPFSSPWSKPSNCNGRGINAPKYFMGSRFFPGPFNTQVCADYALAQNQANAAACKPQCQMFNAQYLHKNFIPYGTYCALYSAPLDAGWATQGTQYSGWDRYDCQQSWTYSLNW